MIQWLSDRRNPHELPPNLIKDETLEPPYTYMVGFSIKLPFLEFIFLKYCKLDKIPQTCTLVTDYITGTAYAYYPINSTFMILK